MYTLITINFCIAIAYILRLFLKESKKTDVWKSLRKTLGTP